MDPKNPGAVDEILNLGDFWNESELKKNKHDIIRCNREIRMRFRSAYRYLLSAKEMQDDMEMILGEGLDRKKLDDLKMTLRRQLVDGLDTMSRSAGVRHLFDSAITPEGLVDYIDTIIPGNYICYYLKSGTGAVSTELLSFLAEEYNMKGYGAELFHQPLNPERLNTLVIEGLKTAFTVNPKIETRANEIIDLDGVISRDISPEKEELFAKDRESYAQMLEEGIRRIKLAKLLHDDLEKIYVGSMDFSGVTEMRNNVVNRIRAILKNK